MNIQILSDRHEHICEAIARTVKYLGAYELKSERKLLEATQKHYVDLLAEELRMIKDENPL